MRARLTYANVAATLALVLAMSGGALAAGHYLINSTRQINPKVLKKLKGARGRAGQNGPIGPQGVTGPPGPKGQRGVQGEPGFSALSRLPSGNSESGDFTAGAPSAENKEEVVVGSATFSVPLSMALTAEHVKAVPVGKLTTECPGVGQAARGYLCLYVASLAGLEAEPLVYDPEAAPTESGPVAGTGLFGFAMSWTTTGPGTPLVFGTYTVTAA